MGNIEKYYFGFLGSLAENYDFTNKKKCAENHIRYMLCRTQSIFKYDGLPDTIPQRNLELMLQTNGNICFYKHNGEMYVFVGGLGGEPDAYYMPTLYTIANPALNISKNLKIGIDCVVMPNDSMYIGLLPLFNRYATALVENEISMNTASINSRIVALISAQDDRTRSAGEKFLKDIADGRTGVIAENTFLDGIKSQPYGTSANNTITNLIEYEQYLRANWFNELGLNANYNMKRESINSGESQLNNDMLSPFIDDMLRCRELALEKVNEMFGTNITVSLDSSWKQNVVEEELALDKTEPTDIEGGADNEV